MRPDTPRPSWRSLGGVALVLALILVLPTTVFGQATPAASPSPSASPSAQASPAASPSLSVAPAKARPDTLVTANGGGFKPGESVDVSFNGASVGTAPVNGGGTFSLSFKVPSLAPADYGVLAKGKDSGTSASTSFTVSESPAALKFSVNEAAPGTAVTITGTGFQPGESVKVLFNGATVGTATADTSGTVTVPLTVPSVAPGNYVGEATGDASGSTASASFNVLPAPAAATTPVPSATPAPGATAGAAANAPAMVHDDRYFSQTGYRIDDDQVWGFFQQYGGLATFGYPVSRNFSFLGCPVQMFQRQIIQVCGGQGPALINMLDPEIFPYTQVNGSNFPAPDNGLKASTPPVSSPTYADDINTFVQQNVPDSFAGQQVNFNQTFNTLGGLTIWGAPISHPQPDPSNGNFIYQRFQRGIMHYIGGQGTVSVLLADYLKAILMNQNVPGDLAAQAKETRFFNQYCPGNTLWLCRPQALSGTDLTFAFEKG